MNNKHYDKFPAWMMSIMISFPTCHGRIMINEINAFCMVFHVRWIFLTTSLQIPLKWLVTSITRFGAKLWEYPYDIENHTKLIFSLYIFLRCFNYGFRWSYLATQKKSDACEKIQLTSAGWSWGIKVDFASWPSFITWKASKLGRGVCGTFNGCFTGVISTTGAAGFILSL